MIYLDPQGLELFILNSAGYCPPTSVAHSDHAAVGAVSSQFSSPTASEAGLPMVSITCDEGYHAFGSDGAVAHTTVCYEGAWQGLPECVPESCGDVHDHGAWVAGEHARKDGGAGETRVRESAGVGCAPGYVASAAAAGGGACAASASASDAPWEMVSFDVHDGLKADDGSWLGTETTGTDAERGSMRACGGTVRLSGYAHNEQASMPDYDAGDGFSTGCFMSAYAKKRFAVGAGSRTIVLQYGFRAWSHRAGGGGQDLPDTNHRLRLEFVDSGGATTRYEHYDDPDCTMNWAPGSANECVLKTAASDSGPQAYTKTLCAAGVADAACDPHASIPAGTVALDVFLGFTKVCGGAASDQIVHRAEFEGVEVTSCGDGAGAPAHFAVACGTDAQFGPLPSCAPLSCPETAESADPNLLGTGSLGGHVVGDTVDALSCADGYAFPEGGPHTAACEFDQEAGVTHWSLPACYPRMCPDVPASSAPANANNLGARVCAGAAQDDAPLRRRRRMSQACTADSECGAEACVVAAFNGKVTGATVSIQCAAGYTAEGSEATCTWDEDAMIWANMPSCEPNECDAVTIDNFGTISGLFTGDTEMVTCSLGYEAVLNQAAQGGAAFRDRRLAAATVTCEARFFRTLF